MPKLSFRHNKQRLHLVSELKKVLDDMAIADPEAGLLAVRTVVKKFKPSFEEDHQDDKLREAFRSIEDLSVTMLEAAVAKKLDASFARLLNEIYFRIGCMEGYLGFLKEGHTAVVEEAPSSEETHAQ